MKRIFQIIHCVENQIPISEEELKLALLCLAHYAAFSTRQFQRLKEKPSFVELGLISTSDFYIQMIRESPDEWLGPQCTPGTPEHKLAQEKMKKIFGEVFEESLNKIIMENQNPSAVENS